MEFNKGDRVKHPSKPEWGLGKVLENSIDGKVLIFFRGAGEKKLSLQHAPLTLVTGEEAKDPRLDVSGKATTKRRKAYQSIEQLKEKFLARFPDGFSDKGFAEIERDYKVEGCVLLNEVLNAQSFDELLSAGDAAEVCRRALQVVHKTNLIYPMEKMSLRNGLKAPVEQKRFAESLFRLLYGHGLPEERFNQFVGCLWEIGAPKWPIATYHLFIAKPKSEMFLKPVVTQDAAAVCGFELNYRVEPNWLTYKCLLEFSNDLMVKLADLKPKDMIDIQSFLWCISQE